MPEASILVTLRDQYSPGVQAMRSANSGFGKSLEETQQKAQAYQTRLAGLVKQQGELQVQLVDAKKALKEAESAYKATGEAADADALARAKEKYESLNAVMKETAQASKDTQNALRELENQGSRMSSGNGTQSAGILSTLGKAGLLSMVGGAAGQWANTLVGSAFGSNVGSVFSSGLSSAVQGAAIGSLAGPVGTAVGAAIGGAIGLATGGSEIFQQRDEAFKSYVQEATQEQMEGLDSSISSGSATAAQRELDSIAFNKLLGKGTGDDFLTRLRTMAADTPMEYSDLTVMSRALAPGFRSDSDRILSLMTGIGNAGSAVGTDSAGMTAMAQALSRMQSSNKASLEYLNMFQERGIDVIGMLANALNTDQGGIYDMISKGSISGTQAVDIIQQGLEQYAGAMDEMAKTFSGLESTLSDAKAELNNAYGEGYNETRKQGLQEEINWLSGESGAIIQEANRAMGAWQAELENSKEQYVRDAMEAVINSDDYKAAMAEGTDEGYAEAGRMLMEAKVRGMNEYNASEGAQLMLEYEMSLAETIREDASTNSAYWDAGYRKGQEYSKGLASGMGEALTEVIKSSPNPQRGGTAAENDYIVVGNLQRGGYKLYSDGTRGYATGLGRVPYDNFPALLHEGERVLTAAETRSYNQGGARSVQIVMNGTVIREEADIDRVAQALLNKLIQADTAGVYR
ncbi:tape measure protein [Lawsonibacter sp. LCP25S3_G6]|uniref:tape measure protein n=1 Tax=unclassified Lawsonibacter TaxID=2617946 RepID=UPI003F95EFDD